MPKRQKVSKREKMEQEFQPPAPTTLFDLIGDSLRLPPPHHSQKDASALSVNSVTGHAHSAQKSACGTDNFSDNQSAASQSDSAQDAASGLPTAKPAYSIRRTKKGGLSLAYESRAKGKKVTVLGNVIGDSSALLSDLKSRTGSGGVARGDSIELQGDHRVFLEKYLKNHPCLVNR